MGCDIEAGCDVELDVEEEVIIEVGGLVVVDDIEGATIVGAGNATGVGGGIKGSVFGATDMSCSGRANALPLRKV